MVGVLVGMAATAGCSLGGQVCAGFALDFAIDTHGEDSPKAAVEAFLRQGTADVPGSGWRQAGTDEGGVRERSGTATLHVTRMPDRTWVVDSGSTC
jgi:hypothetical protein